MRVLVTGAGGFVGRAVAAELRGHGHEVLTPGRAAADVRDRAALATAVAGGVDAVCHLAALTRVRDSLTDPVGYFDVNVTGTLNLLAVVGDGVPFVLASTAAVYGAQQGALGEDLPVAPGNPYAASKLAAELAVGAAAAAGRVAATTLRCFNVAGPGDADLSRIVPKTLAVAAGTADRLQINGDGGAVREYVHVRDVAAAFRLALETSPGRAGAHRVLNVGTGEGATVAEVVATARRATGREIPAEHLPPRPEPERIVADSGRIRAELGWAPERSSLERILRDAWAVSAPRAAAGPG